MNREENVRRPMLWLSIIGVGFMAIGIGLIVAGAIADPNRNSLIAFGGVVIVVGGLVAMWTLIEWLTYRRNRQDGAKSSTLPPGDLGS